MKIIFDNGDYERVIGNGSSYEEVVKVIKQFLRDHSYKSYYTRLWKENGRIKIDVGCWSQFFFVEGDQDELDKVFRF